MNFSLLKLFLITSIMLFQSATSIAAQKAKECPIKKVTSAYLNSKETIAANADIGAIYKAYMKSILALKKQDSFKNFEIVSQSVDLQENYNSKEFKTLTINVTIEFELDYRAVSDLASKLANTTLSVTTYDIAKCERKGY